MHPVPQPVAPDSWVIRHQRGRVTVNSLVIVGRQPAVVDTGCGRDRESWLEHLASVVSPAAVRWVVLSREDPDHTGNLASVLAACPHALVAATAVTFARRPGGCDVPAGRRVTVAPGDRLDLGDRCLRVLPALLCDRPGGLVFVDDATGVLWDADGFSDAAPAACPWIDWVDTGRWLARVAALESNGITTIVPGHGPVIGPAHVADAFARLRLLPLRGC